MSDVVMLPGRLLILEEPPIDRTASGRILFPDVERITASCAFVLLHTQKALERNMTSRRIVFSKHSGKTLELKGTKLRVIREGAVLAYFLKERHMEKNQIAERVADYIKSLPGDDLDPCDVAAAVEGFLDDLDEEAETDDEGNDLEDPEPEQVS